MKIQNGWYEMVDDDTATPGAFQVGHSYYFEQRTDGQIWTKDDFNEPVRFWNPWFTKCFRPPERLIGREQ